MILNKIHGNMGMGMIPKWQLSLDPAVNIKINPNVRFPEGTDQTTVQPFGMESPLLEAGLGAMHFGSRRGTSVGCCDGGNTPDACCGGYQARAMTLGNVFDFVDSPIFKYRKWIVLGGLGLVGFALLGGAGALLR
jgi:hypothetical protein